MAVVGLRRWACLRRYMSPKVAQAVTDWVVQHEAGERSDVSRRRGAARGHARLYLKNHNCTTPSQRRSAFACSLNIFGLVKRFGRARVMEFTFSFPDNVVTIVERERRWRRLQRWLVQQGIVHGVLVWERQKRGAWHGHCTIVMPFAYEGDVSVFRKGGEVDQGCYIHVDPQLKRWWHKLNRVKGRLEFGRDKLRPIMNLKAWAGYNNGYVAKAFAEGNEGGLGRWVRDRSRRWSAWGGRSATCNFAWRESVMRPLLMCLADCLGMENYDDFKRILGFRWGRVLCPFIRRAHFNFFVRYPDKVKAVAAALRSGFWEQAEKASEALLLGAGLEEVEERWPCLEGALSW